MNQLNAPLDALLARLAPTLDDVRFVFARADASSPDVEAFAVVREPTGLTLVIDELVAAAAGLEPLLRCRRIDTGVDTPLEGVGFLAAIAHALAAESIALNPIAGAARDHLFVSAGDAERAKSVLERLAREARARIESSRDVEDVLAFWFGTTVDGFSDAATRRRWFNSTPEIDADIARRFGHLLERARTGSLSSWLAAPRGALAYILVTDQFSRQVHRGTARAFASDTLALAAARAAVANRFDFELPLDARAFVYMPFMHSEAREDQRTSLRLFAALAEAAPRGDDHFAASLRSAHEHHDLIERFGRFPHRNAPLGRGTTTAEAAYLDTASGFGQKISR